VKYAEGAYDEAYIYLQRYVDVAPGHAGARKLLGSLMLERRDPYKAITVLEPAVRIAPDDPGILTMMGDAYAAVGRHPAATEMYEKAARIEPDRGKLRAQLGLARIRSGLVEQGLADLEAAVDIGSVQEAT